MLLQQDRVSIREDLIEETENQREIKILQGEMLGRAVLAES